jgi:hypothetical protein
MEGEVGCITMLLNVVTRLMERKGEEDIDHESKTAEVTRRIQGEVTAEMSSEVMILMVVQLEYVKTNYFDQRRTIIRKL